MDDRNYRNPTKPGAANMSNDPSEPHSIWLLPAAELDASLRSVIGDLAQRQDAPPFAPHLTLLGDLNGPIGATRDAVQTAFADIGPIEARVDKLRQSPRFFMSLYLATTVPDAVTAARQRLSHALRGGDAPPFEPHISLAYGPLPAACDAPGVTTLAAPFLGRGITFPVIAVVRSAKSIPIQDWVIEATIEL